MNRSPGSRGARWWGLLALALAGATPVRALLAPADLEAPRTVTVRDWLSLRLQVLGLELSYPAYRIAIRLEPTTADGPAGVRFEFWISTPMAEHLVEAGRDETERILTYHANGIQRRVEELLRRDLGDLFGEGVDVEGEFLVPDDDLEAPPQRWAQWRGGELEWSWRP